MKRQNPSFYILLVLFIFLQIADLYTTKIGLVLGFSEGNFLLNWSLDPGFYAPFVVKVILTLIVFWLLCIAGRSGKSQAQTSLLIIIVLMICAVFRNIYLLNGWSFLHFWVLRNIGF